MPRTIATMSVLPTPPSRYRPNVHQSGLTLRRPTRVQAPNGPRTPTFLQMPTRVLRDTAPRPRADRWGCGKKTPAVLTQMHAVCPDTCSPLRVSACMRSRTRTSGDHSAVRKGTLVSNMPSELVMRNGNTCRHCDTRGPAGCLRPAYADG